MCLTNSTQPVVPMQSWLEPTIQTPSSSVQAPAALSQYAIQPHIGRPVRSRVSTVQIVACAQSASLATVQSVPTKVMPNWVQFVEPTVCAGTHNADAVSQCTRAEIDTALCGGAIQRFDALSCVGDTEAIDGTDSGVHSPRNSTVQSVPAKCIHRIGCNS